MINKKKILKNITIGLGFCLLAIQFIHPEKNLSAATANDITHDFTMPDEVQKILKTSCYDCHSNSTEYPWYSKIQPVDWWLTNHINDGKRSLNFNEFSGYRLFRQYHKFEGIMEELKDDGMPLPSYLWIHHDAKLSADQKAIVSNWAKAMSEEMKAKYPADSLVNPKKRK